MKLLTISLGISNLVNLFFRAYNALIDLVLEFVQHIFSILSYDINAVC